jgi:hypothetical protein
LTAITVAICTRNRCALLDRALASLARVVVPDHIDWELLVVDNGSEDATAATIARFADLLPLRAIEERTMGKSHAMNTAVREARGDILAWIDDDVLVDPQWMCAYHEAFLQNPEMAFFGGPIIPLFEGPRPPWLDGALRHVANAYAALDLGSEAVPFRGDTLPYGANWAIRLNEQRRHLYDPRLGRKGDVTLSATLLRGEWRIAGPGAKQPLRVQAHGPSALAMEGSPRAGVPISVAQTLRSVGGMERAPAARKRGMGDAARSARGGWARGEGPRCHIITRGIGASPDEVP